MIMTSSIPDMAKVNIKRYAETRLPRLIEECKSLPPSSFIFQLGGAPAQTAKLVQEWIATNCSEFNGKNERLKCYTSVGHFWATWYIITFCHNFIKYWAIL